tara:strand:- start:111 stop:272 length:162 start_codon:yes stop_codon:yes gene_type:complete
MTPDLNVLKKIVSIEYGDIVEAKESRINTAPEKAVREFIGFARDKLSSYTAPH